jgi:hypothetical protein
LNQQNKKKKNYTKNIINPKINHLTLLLKKKKKNNKKILRLLLKPLLKLQLKPLSRFQQRLQLKPLNP